MRYYLQERLVSYRITYLCITKIFLFPGFHAIVNTIGAIMGGLEGA